MDIQIVPHQPGVLLRGDQRSGGVSKIVFFNPFIPILNLFKSHSISSNNPPIRINFETLTINLYFQELILKRGAIFVSVRLGLV